MLHAIWHVVLIHTLILIVSPIIVCASAIPFHGLAYPDIVRDNICVWAKLFQRTPQAVRGAEC
jgi:hypothetical protein